MSDQAQPIPEGFRTVTPHLVIKNCAEAIDFYKRAFGAQELFRSTNPGSDDIMHASIMIGDSVVMLADEFPDWGVLGPESLGGSPVTIHLYVEDADALWERAVGAGATVVMPLEDTFWGDRYGKVKDPYGHGWAIATHIKDMSPEEMQEAAIEAFSQQPGGE